MPSVVRTATGQEQEEHLGAERGARGSRLAARGSRLEARGRLLSERAGGGRPGRGAGGKCPPPVGGPGRGVSVPIATARGRARAGASGEAGGE